MSLRWSLLQSCCTRSCDFSARVWTDFDACMFGGQRKKRTAIVSNRSWFCVLSKHCDGGHDHLPWGKVLSNGNTAWSTALESAYSWGLSKALVQCLLDGLGLQRENMPLSSKQQKRRLLEPEFGNIQILLDPPAEVLRTVPPCTLQGVLGLPKGTRLLRVDRASFRAVIRTPLDPVTWCQRAMQLPHPSHSLQDLPTPVALAKFRTYESRKLRRIVEECEGKETRARCGLDPSVQAVTAPKKSVATEQLLSSVQRPDLDVARQIREGFPLVGWLEPSNLWEKRLEVPALTPQALMEAAPDIAAASRPQVSRNVDPAITSGVWEATSQEASVGWLSFQDERQLSPVSRIFSVRFEEQDKANRQPQVELSKCSLWHH